MRFVLLAATAALSIAAPVEAATIVQTGTVGSNLPIPFITLFNPALGVLTGVHVRQTFSLSGSAWVSVAGPSEWQAKFITAPSTLFGGCDACLTTVAASSVINSGPTSAYLTRTVETDFLDLALMTGPGYMNINYLGSAGSSFTQVSGAPATGIIPDLRANGGTIRYELTYTYAVPEPATWAMMITGFGFVGGSMRRRKTVTALHLRDFNPRSPEGG